MTINLTGGVAANDLKVPVGDREAFYAVFLDWLLDIEEWDTMQIERGKIDLENTIIKREDFDAFCEELVPSGSYVGSELESDVLHRFVIFARDSEALAEAVSRMATHASTATKHGEQPDLVPFLSTLAWSIERIGRKESRRAARRAA